jgi:plasmid stability protein
MSITLNPELEARLRIRAEEEGVTVDAYLERLVRDEAAEIAYTETLLQEAADSGHHIELTEEEWDRMEQEALAEAQVKSHPRE